MVCSFLNVLLLFLAEKIDQIHVTVAVSPKPTDLDTIRSTITIDEWNNKIKVWKESTLTSPSGFHLTHSRALISPHNIPPDHQDYDTIEQQ